MLFPHEQYACDINHAMKLCKTRFFWVIDYLVDYDDFDFLWEPVPWEAQQRHAWPTQYQADSGTYLVPRSGFVDTNYHTDVELFKTSDKDLWQIPAGIEDFDYDWHPDAGDQPYIYQFGTQHQATGGPVYHVPGATMIKYVKEPRATKISTDANWDRLDAAFFDYTWHPDDRDPPYIHEFGTQHQITGGPRYIVNGAKITKYHPSVQRETKVSVDKNWRLIDIDQFKNFDWTWHPDNREQPYIYQFATQHQKTGGPVYEVPGATEVKYISEIKGTVNPTSTVYVIDHIDGFANRWQQTLKNVNVKQTVRYVESYLETLKRIARNANEEFIWVVSSICDYSDFDFSWHPEKWQLTSLHVFASNNEKFGDTFFMHTPSFRERAENVKMLEWYDLNFVESNIVRYPCQAVVHDENSHVNVVKSHVFTEPLVVFSKSWIDTERPAVPLWRKETRAITALNNGRCVIVPREAQASIKTQLYDYPYIIKKYDKSRPYDYPIVFVSNGEDCAEENYTRLHNLVGSKRNKLIRVDRVAGRQASQLAAAAAAGTDYYFFVPSKLAVDENFDWQFQPDLLQQAKHYIFHAHNPINQLEYGHMAMVMYCRQLVESTLGKELDFTLESPHEVVAVRSGTVNFGNDPKLVWRTAFREVIKLKHSLATRPDIDTDFRLEQWLESGTGPLGRYSQLGAQAACDYYTSVGGNYEKLMLTYEWDYVDSLYQTVSHFNL